jgi:hypothetical protein
MSLLDRASTSVKHTQSHGLSHGLDTEVEKRGNGQHCTYTAVDDAGVCVSFGATATQLRIKPDYAAMGLAHAHGTWGEATRAISRLVPVSDLVP